MKIGTKHEICFFCQEEKECYVSSLGNISFYFCSECSKKVFCDDGSTPMEKKIADMAEGIICEHCGHKNIIQEYVPEFISISCGIVCDECKEPCCCWINHETEKFAEKLFERVSDGKD